MRVLLAVGGSVATVGQLLFASLHPGPGFSRLPSMSRLPAIRLGRFKAKCATLLGARHVPERL